MPSSYVTSGDLTTYGAPASTAGQIIQASIMVDMYLKRPEGLVWNPDSIGQPCYMAALTPSLSFAAPGGLSPGSNVAAAVTGPTNMLQVGDVLILDRADPSLTEAVIVNAITPGVSIGFQSVLNSHAGGVALEAGLVIQEQRFLPDQRPLTTLGRTPVARIIGGTGRYGYGRRGDVGAENINDFNLLAALSKFGGPPVWEIFAGSNNALGTSIDVDPNTGQTWIPAGIMLAYYTEVKVRYVAGFQASAIPAAVKLATIQLLAALAESPNLGAVKSYKAGDTSITRFADTNISGDVRLALQRYQARTFA